MEIYNRDSKDRYFIEYYYSKKYKYTHIFIDELETYIGLCGKSVMTVLTYDKFIELQYRDQVFPNFKGLFTKFEGKPCRENILMTGYVAKNFIDKIIESKK